MNAYKSELWNALRMDALNDLESFVRWYADTYCEQMERDGFCHTTEQALQAWLDLDDGER